MKTSRMILMVLATPQTFFPHWEKQAVEPPPAQRMPRKVSYKLLMAPREKIKCIWADPQVGIAVLGEEQPRKLLTYASGPLEKALKAWDQEDPWVDLFRTTDGTLWAISMDPEHFHQWPWHWDGKCWDIARIDWDPRWIDWLSSQPMGPMRPTTMFRRHIRGADGADFLIGCGGVLVHRGGARWGHLYVQEKPPCNCSWGHGIEIRPGGEGSTDVFLLKCGRTVHSWTGERWETSDTTSTPFPCHEFDRVYRFSNGACAGFSTARELRFVGNPAPAAIASWVRDLDHDDPKVRDEATATLTIHHPSLERYLKSRADLPLSTEQIFRLATIRAAQENLGRVIRVEGRPVEITNSMPILKHPSKDKVLFYVLLKESTRSSDWKFAELDGEGRSRILGPAMDPAGYIPDTVRFQADPRGPVYWSWARRTFRWDDRGVVERNFGDARLAGLGPGGEAVFRSGGDHAPMAFSVSLDLVGRELERKFDGDVFENDFMNAELGPDGRLRAIMRCGPPPAPLGSHQKVTWRHHVFTEGRWKVEEDSPTYVLYHCSLQACHFCHGGNAARRALIPPAKARSYITCILSGNEVLEKGLKDTVWKPRSFPTTHEPGPGFIVRSRQGPAWALTPAGLFRLVEENGRWRISGHWMLEFHHQPMILDARDNLWLLRGEQLIRFAVD